ncbi:MAG: HAD family hydrolase [Planctomycetota bacterium]
MSNSPPPLARFKVIALDLDGTLLAHGSELSRDCVAWVGRARARGLAPVIATGRRFATTRPVMELLALDTPAVVQNGAVVVTRDGARLQSWYLDNEVHRAAIAMLKHFGLAPIAYLDAPGGPAEFFLEAGARDPTGYLQVYTRASRGQFSVVQDLNQARLKAVTRVITVDDPDRLRDAQAVITEQLGDRLRSFITHDPHYDVKRLELMHRSASKLSGVELIAASLGASIDQVIAFGDDVNDIEMIEHSGFGVAVHNANQEVKAVADHVTATAMGDGFIEAMRWILGES